MSLHGRVRAAVVLTAYWAAACHAVPAEQPRAAVCFFGLTRSLAYTIENIRSSIFDQLISNGINYSVFVHTYSVTVVKNPRSREHNVPVDWTLYRLLQPTAGEVEDRDAVYASRFNASFDRYLAHGDAWRESHHTSLRNLLLALHSQERVLALQEQAARQQGPFDIVILLRSDLWFFNRLNVEHIREAMQSENTLYTPIFDAWGGLNDRLLFGKPAAVSKVAHRLELAIPYAATAPLHAEKLLKHAVDVFGLRFHNTDITFQRVRANGFLARIPQFGARGGVEKWKKGKYMKLNRNQMWVLVEKEPDRSLEPVTAAMMASSQVSSR